MTPAITAGLVICTLVAFSTLTFIIYTLWRYPK